MRQSRHFHFFMKIFCKHKSSNVYEVIRAVLNFLFYFFTKRFHTHKKHQKKQHKKHVKSTKTHISKQKQKRQHFYVHKKHLKGRKLLV